MSSVIVLQIDHYVNAAHMEHFSLHATYWAAGHSRDDNKFKQEYELEIEMVHYIFMKYSHLQKTFIDGRLSRN